MGKRCAGSNIHLTHSADLSLITPLRVRLR
jgi:hypothetical protein